MIKNGCFEYKKILQVINIEYQKQIISFYILE